MAVNGGPALTMGPVLFNWAPEQWRDFHARIAAEAPVDTVYVGEVICAKRAALFQPYYQEVVERIVQAGKKVVFCTLAEVMTTRERQIVEGLCELDDVLIEANDGSAIERLRGRPHAIGPFCNVYNEDTLAFLATKGAVHVTVPPELPARSVRAMTRRALELGVSVEVQVYGRVPLALSARCYHARAHGRAKDNCEFVCGRDPDGMALRTLQGTPFLAVNGTQTLSHACLNLVHESGSLRDMGVSAFRLSPHSHDMVETARLFRGVLDGETPPDEACARLAAMAPDMPFCNGFHHGVGGHLWLEGGRPRAPGAP